MNTRQIGPAFRGLRRLLAAPDAAETSDTHLLRRFVSQRDESAFELLAWRHGPMVLGLCLRMLRDGHDAEDAFQATLLVLARKASSIGRHESLGSWLYKVAYRVALRAREIARRRARHERQVDALPDPGGPADPGWAELRPVLDEELARLPEKLRAPVVLCYLEGLTNEEAAQRLACPAGTLKTRSAQARRLLAERLSRRGLALAAGVAIGGMLPAAAAPPAAQVAATVRAAADAAADTLATGVVSAPVAHLTEGVLRAMTVMKLKNVAAVLVLALAVAAAGGASMGAFADGPPDQEQAQPKAAPGGARVKKLRMQIADLNRQLRQAEEEAAREKEAARKEAALPPHDRPLAVIFGDEQVTREEVAEYLLARMTSGQFEQYLQFRILEHAARAKGVRVSDAEVDAHLKQELKRAGLSEKAFREQVLLKQQKNLREWKVDMVRPRVLLKKLAAATRVSEIDLRAAYEARFGEKVECRAIVVNSGGREAAEHAAESIRSGKVTFDKEAERLRPGGVAVAVTVSRRPPKGAEAVSKAAFALEPREVSRAVVYGDGFVILECLRRVPANASVRFEDAREGLRRELAERIRDEAAKELFEGLKAEARPKLLWTPRGDGKQ